ncbi:hypothetical protein WMO44_14050 [Faecalibacterium sp. CLA-AA-H175]|uniref:Uncharacterized protein n=1 Tax=Faecalibacterium tardum TaxID=3133156 RepID=A0ABV1AZS6_9FIRM
MNNDEINEDTIKNSHCSKIHSGNRVYRKALPLPAGIPKGLPSVKRNTGASADTPVF